MLFVYLHISILYNRVIVISLLRLHTFALRLRTFAFATSHLRPKGESTKVKNAWPNRNIIILTYTRTGDHPGVKITIFAKSERLGETKQSLDWAAEFSKIPMCDRWTKLRKLQDPKANSELERPTYLNLI